MSDLAAVAERARLLGLDLRVVPQTGSTNADLKEAARQGAPHGRALLADAQTAGRGRLGRSWQSPAGANVHLSVLLRPEVPLERVPLLCLGAASVVAEACGPAFRIKWPNDVLAPDGRKVAGLLAEAEGQGSALDWVVLGIGVNVGAAPPELPATSVRAVEPDAERGPLALAVLQGILALPEAVRRDPGAVLDRWRSRAHTLGRRVRVGAVEGVAEDVDASGALRVRTAGGRLQRVLAGDVEMVGRA